MDIFPILSILVLIYFFYGEILELVGSIAKGIAAPRFL